MKISAYVARTSIADFKLGEQHFGLVSVDRTTCARSSAADSLWEPSPSATGFIMAGC